MSNLIDRETILLRVATDVISMRREIIDLWAGHMAVIEYLCCLAEKTSGVEASAAKQMILELTQKHRQALLEGVEDISASMAAILDTRSDSDVADGLHSP